MGLSSVHGIVTAMRGLIDVDTVANVGTRFDVYLPECAEPETPRDVDVPVNDTAAAGGCVMVVDDEEAITAVARAVLSKTGFRVRTFNDAAEAIVAFEKDPGSVDAIVCDFTMPKMNGIEFAQRVSAVRPDLPIVLATGIIDTDDLKSADMAGVWEVMKKPFRMDTLVNVVVRCVDRAPES